MLARKPVLGRTLQAFLCGHRLLEGRLWQPGFQGDLKVDSGTRVADVILRIAPIHRGRCWESMFPVGILSTMPSKMIRASQGRRLPL